MFLSKTRPLSLVRRCVPLFWLRYQMSQSGVLKAVASRVTVVVLLVENSRDLRAEARRSYVFFYRPLSRRTRKELAPSSSLNKRYRAMKKVSEYEAHAAECRKMASQMSNPEHRKQLIEMAETWDMLAQARAKQLKRKKNNGEPPRI